MRCLVACTLDSKEVVVEESGQFDVDMSLLDCSTCPVLDIQEIRPVAVSEFYDGAESGLVFWADRLHAFVTVEIVDGRRKYALLYAGFADNERLQLQVSNDLRVVTVLDPPRWRIGALVGCFFETPGWYREGFVR
jgi:hypothetical protein